MTVVAYLSLAVGLGSGGAWASTQVGAKDLKRNAVRAKHVKASQIKARHVERGAIGTAKIRARAVTRAKLAPGVEVAGPKGDKGDKGDKGASAWEVDCNEGLATDDEMVRVGSSCIDKYEASIWDQPRGGRQLTTRDELDSACPQNGQPSGSATCTRFFARSVAGVKPVRSISWFQAQQALANTGKRLPTNAEWQAAVSGTPDSDACNIGELAISDTGARAGCRSRFGAFDMIGNVWELVADWDEAPGGCANWPATGFGADISCIGRSDGVSSRLPGAIARGGDTGNLADAGAFAVSAFVEPGVPNPAAGFRGAR